MDLIRYGLIACIIATGLFIAKQWAMFEEEHRTNTITYNQATQTTSTAVEELPDDIASVSDIPQLASPTALADVPLVSNNGSFINVLTDTLELKINLTGGDIEFAALPLFRASLDEGAKAFTLLENNNVRRYIAQSGLIGPNGTDTVKGRAKYSSAYSEYTLTSGQDILNVDLVQTLDNNILITKRYIFKRGSYAVNVEHIVQNNSQNIWQAALYGQLKRDNTEDPGADNSGLGMKPFLGAATRTNDANYDKINFKDFAQGSKENVANSYISIVQHYFISAWIPAANETTTISTKRSQNGDNLIRFTAPLTTVERGETGSIESVLYIGPKDQYSLEKLAPGLELTVDYGWLWFIAQPIFAGLTFIYGLVGNWGWAIIFLTVFIKALFYPLSAASYRSMAKMRKLTPKMQSIRETYSEDKQKQSAEMMSLYKKEKVNPLGGCLPVIIQMPVFISLYWVLSESVELRHSPWLLWIDDLASMDPYFILPLIMGVSMFIQQKLNPTPPDPMQAKIMQWLPVMFTVFFLFFPAGLVLYWVVNNILSISQQWVITRKIEKADS